MGYLLLFIIICALWEYKYSSSAKYLLRLKKREPEFYKKYCSNILLSPQQKILRLSTQGHYENIADQALKTDFLQQSERVGKFQVFSFLLFPIGVLIVVGILIFKGGFSAI